MLDFLDLVETVTEDMVNAVTGTMAIHSAAWDHSVGMVCTVTVDMVTITEAVMVHIIPYGNIHGGYGHSQGYPQPYTQHQTYSQPPTYTQPSYNQPQTYTQPPTYTQSEAYAQ